MDDSLIQAFLPPGFEPTITGSEITQVWPARQPVEWLLLSVVCCCEWLLLSVMCYCICHAQGELTITATMEALGNSLYLDLVPETWAKRAYPSLYGLTQWYMDMLLRVKELESWTSDFQLPSAVWLAGFFNPQSFLTAIMQQVNLCIERHLAFSPTCS